MSWAFVQPMLVLVLVGWVVMSYGGFWGGGLTGVLHGVQAAAGEHCHFHWCQDFCDHLGAVFFNHVRGCVAED